MLNAPLDVFTREREYRDARPLPNLEGRTVILIDDGIATGSSMITAVRAVREMRPRFVVAAAPVMSRSAAWLVREYADACESILVLEHLFSVGLWYGDFTPTTDEEVRAMLERAPAPPLQRSTMTIDHPGRSI
jgi:putative phosphoribosyl transferase